MTGTIEQLLRKGRRSFLARGAGGLGVAALGTLLSEQSPAAQSLVPNALPRAKR
ncbi:MAG: hypothetical protein RLZZ458_2902, partial [Planctomycetota bacterium]